MIIRNDDIKSLVVEVPEGHKHLRTTIALQDGTELVFQEATIASVVRAYVDIKTHPQKNSVMLICQKIEERKEGYAEWQLMEMRDSYIDAVNDKLFMADIKEIERDFRHGDLEYDNGEKNSGVL